MTLSLDHPIGERFFGLRLDTLIRLRWLAISGQTLAIVVVQWLLGFTLPLGACLAVVALSAWLNLALRLRNPGARRLSDVEAAWLLAYDILQLAALLFLTGGLANPFALLFLAPVLISATALSPRTTILLGILAAICAGLVGLWQMPLPWATDGTPMAPVLPPLYLAAIWLALAIAIGFIGVHAWRVAEETRELSEALAATELVLAREQHISALDGLAAAAAHELGTPLATITVVAKELARAVPDDSPLADDIRLLREQSERCRTILRRLTSLEAGDAPFDRMPLSHILEDVVAPHRNFGIAITIAVPAPAGDEPVIARNPGLLYGLGNIVENAVDFAESAVNVIASWSETEVAVTFTDDGPGFPPELIDSIGAPYVTSRGRNRWRRDAAPEAEEETRQGLGLGVFIAKTLLERSGAELSFVNRAAPAHGASVTVRWPRAKIDISEEGDEPAPESELTEDPIPRTGL
ncbi:ActS/PrrB/RegB family redox-sensitive histidine kinase [Ancylobacter sp. WKF20]|uniref:ActS/PrrB/RegB family redox-sensitive histidine kinase n=1 Tax=Ancylobacter sp. WKF20 TaxID=3039801 RepID=UPI0024342F6F|nr:ActS/PrrB/RegB family redox-sensitive histidine kinase [Ancylobacter sp. WKF20]WGD29430.1 ActS/PrrB/RegB family redox-sensitive histidine kinase [Ancylobacter sp. WKF20]